MTANRAGAGDAAPATVAARHQRGPEGDAGLRWLVPELGKLVCARVSGTEWKPICLQFGISRPTAYRRWEYGLSAIVWRLNGRRVPTKRSRRYLAEGVRGR